jgi:hypothetical protein
MRVLVAASASISTGSSRRCWAGQLAHVALDHVVLGRLRHDIEAVGPLDQLDGRLGDGPGGIHGRRRRDQLPQGADDLGGLGVGELEQTARGGRRQQPPALGHRPFVRLHRLGPSGDEQVAGEGIEVGGGRRPFLGVPAFAQPVVDIVGLLHQRLGIGAG